MGLKSRLKDAERLLNKAEYTAAAKECVGLIEQVLRQMLLQYAPQLEEKDRLKVQEAAQKRPAKRIEALTMGQVINVIRESAFFDAWGRVSGRTHSKIRLINLDRLNELRNELIHTNRNADPSEAKFLCECLQAILGDVDILSKTADLMLLKGKSNAAEQARILVAVSYARADDRPIDAASEGWITTFAAKLKDLLAPKLQSLALDSFCIDSPWHNEDHVTADMFAAIQQAAILLLIGSRNYVTSDWCDEEFLGMMRTRVHKDASVFIIELNRSTYANRPPEFDEIADYRYDFGMSAGESEADEALTPAMYRYHNLLTNVSCDLANALAKLREQQQHAALLSQTITPLVEKPPAVFLAGVTDDLEEHREELKGTLAEARIQVIPEVCYFTAPDVFEHAIREDLQKSALFVQLLGAFSGKKLPGLPKGYYVRRQYELAREIGKRILQWRAPELDVTSLQDHEWAEFLQLDTVRALAFEDLLAAIIQTLAPAKPVQKPAGALSPPLVFLDADTDDLDLADNLGKVLINSGIECLLPFAGSRPAETRKIFEQSVLACDAMMIIYGRVPPEWVSDQFLAIRRIETQRERPFAAYAIYDGPPEPKARVNVLSPRISILQCRNRIDEHQLGQFISAVQAG
jgi:hypothetical protein